MGAVYEGGWKFDMQHGYGVEKWLNSGSIFRGEFIDGLRNGPGIWLHNNKRYEGDWKNNMMDGQGTMEWGVSIKKEKSQISLPATGGTDLTRRQTGKVPDD